jgi:hypothetical protein
MTRYIILSYASNKKGLGFLNIKRKLQYGNAKNLNVVMSWGIPLRAERE